MPNRIVREGILTSRRVNRLTAEEEVFYRRLLSAVDDFGRTFADPSLLRAALYPLRLDEVGEEAIEGYLRACAAADLLVLYTVDGERYLELLRFRQQVRSKASKHPAPADAQQVPTPCVAPATRPRTKTNPNPNPNPEAKSKTKPTEEGEGIDARPADAGTLTLLGTEENRPKARRAPGKTARFVPPAVEEVRAYVAELGAVFSPERFVSFYEQRGWRTGKAPGFPMRDWRAACRDWKSRDDEEGRTGPVRPAGLQVVPDWKKRREEEDAARAAAEIAEAESLRREKGLPC